MKIKEIASHIRERVPSTSIRADDYVSTDNMRPNFGGIEPSPSLPPSGNVTAYQEGDILLSNIRPYFRKTWLATHGGGCNADVLCIRANPDKCLPKYLYYLFTTDNFVNDYLKSCKGAKMPRGDIQRLLDYEFNLPDLPTQLRIAGVLGSIDEKIELNRKKIAELEALAKTIYDYWFVQFDFPDKNGKPYKSSGGKMVWNEQLKRNVPEGWEAVPLESLLARLPATKRLPTDEYGIDGEFPIVDQSETFIAGYSSDQSAVLSLPKCVVFGDHSCTVKMVNFPFCRGADGTQILVSNDESVISTYQLYLYVEHLKFDGQYKRHFSFLKQHLIPFKRTLCLGQAFSDVIEPAFDSIRNCREAIRLLIRERDTLLPLLMNGQVEVG